MTKEKEIRLYFLPFLPDRLL